MTNEMNELMNEYQERSIEAMLWYNTRSVTIAELEARLDELLAPLLKQLFTAGRQWTNTFMRDEFVKANKKWDLDLKYNKDVLTKFNDQYSIFQGYYDTKYRDMFSRREIDALKRRILTAKYSGLPESEALDLVKSTTNITTNRARLLYRYEKAQLDSTVHQIYFEDGLKNEYDKVWISRSDSATRMEHKAMNGKVADEDGYFDSPKGKILGPPLDYNCRCTVEFVKKQED